MSAINVDGRRPLAGRVAVVTAAGAGIGRACARRYALDGAHVLVNALHTDSAAAVASEIVAAGGSASAFAGDVGNVDVVEAMIEAALEVDGHLDVLHNNAADTTSSLVATMSDDGWHRVIRTTLDSVFFGIRAALRSMIPRRSGVIITTTSSSGLGGVAGFGAYGAAKAAVENLVRTAAVENARFGIRINSICPGTVESRSTTAWLDRNPDSRANYVAQIPQRRLGLPDEVANVAAFLASDEASYVNGATFVVDGAVAARVALPLDITSLSGE